MKKGMMSMEDKTLSLPDLPSNFFGNTELKNTIKIKYLSNYNNLYNIPFFSRNINKNRFFKYNAKAGYYISSGLYLRGLNILFEKHSSLQFIPISFLCS